jgi:hypothetical protein
MIKQNKLPDDILQRIAALPARLERDERLVFAYLFGGLASGGDLKPLSDVDLAVYLDPRTDRAEAKLDLIGVMAAALGTDEFDLVILNDAPLSLSGRILQNRRVLVDKRPFIRHAYESLTLREFCDFHYHEQTILLRRFV